jgi:GGDEF domain-containing protein
MAEDTNPFADLPDAEEDSTPAAKSTANPFADLPDEGPGRVARGIAEVVNRIPEAAESAVKGLARGGPLAPIVNAIGTETILEKSGIRDRQRERDQKRGRESGELGDVRGGGIRNQNKAFQTPEATRERNRPPAYKNKQEAIDDLANLLDEGVDQAEVMAAAERMGVAAEVRALASSRQPAGPAYEPRDPNAPEAASGTIGPAQEPPEQARGIRNMYGMPGSTPQTMLERGIVQARQVSAVLGLEGGSMDEGASARKLAAVTKGKPGYAADVEDGLEAIGNAKTDAGFWQAVIDNPKAAFALLGESVIASAPSFLPAIAGSALGPTGTAAGVAAGSGAFNYGSAIVEFMQGKGIDPSDPVAVERFFRNKELMAEAREYSLRYSVPVTLFDTISAAVAGKFANAARKAIDSGKLTRMGAVRAVGKAGALELGMQAGAAATGESVGQYQKGGDYSPADLWLEVFADLPSGVGEVALNMAAEMRKEAGKPGSGIEPAGPGGGGTPSLTGPFATVQDRFTPVEGGFQTPNGSVITPEQWDNASPRVRAGWMESGEQAPTVSRETVPGMEVTEGEDITAAPAPPEETETSELRRLADSTTDAGVRADLLRQADAADAVTTRYETGMRQADELERLAGETPDNALAGQLRARAEKLRRNVAPKATGITVTERSLDDEVGQTPQTPLSTKGIKVTEGTVEAVEVEDVDPFSEQGADFVPLDRRKNAERRAKVAEMTPEEMQRELLTSQVTGLPNKRAFDEGPVAPTVTNVDVDSLKWINDTLGHAVGDELLAKVGAAFKAVGVNAFHISGDEFRVNATDVKSAEAAMRKVNAILKKESISATLPDGTVITKRGIGVSYGHGSNTNEAETALQRSKAERTAKGLRPERGAEPRGVDRAAPREGSTPRGAGVGQPGRVQSRVGTKQETLTHGQSRFLQEIVDSGGGLSMAAKSELNVDRKKADGKPLKWQMGGGRGELFRNESGLQGDDLVEWLEQHGYISQADIDEANANKTGGAIGLAYDLVRRELDEPGSVVKLADADERAAADADRARRMELEREAAELGIDTSLDDDELDQQIRDRQETDFRESSGFDIPETERAAWVQLAAQLDEAALERAAMQFPDDDAAFMRAVQEIINGNSEAVVGTRAGDESPAGTEDPGRQAGVEGPQDREAGAGRGQAAGDTQQGPGPEQDATRGRTGEPSGLDGDAAARARVDTRTADLFGALPNKTPDAGIAALEKAAAESVTPGALPEGSRAAVEVVTRKMGALRVPAGKMESRDQAASAFAYLRKYPREYLDALILDKDGTPIAHWRGFMGALTQTSVYPAELAKFAAAIPGAHSIWLAHNHPSGLAELSRADLTLTDNIRRLLRGSIELRGMLAIAGNRFAYTPDGTLIESNANIPPALRTREVPVLERVVLRNGMIGSPINSPESARSARSTLLKDKPGLLFLNAQNGPVASVPYEILQGTQALRNTQELKDLLGMASRINPGAVIIYTGVPGTPGTAVAPRLTNLANLFRALDIRVLDVIGSDGSSAAETGRDPPVQDFAALWYSPLQRAVEAITTNKASPQQWANTIRALKGVTPMEIEWSGVLDWLKVQEQGGATFERALLDEGRTLSPGDRKRLAANPGTVNGKITRDEVVAFIRDNGVKVTETVLTNDVDRGDQQAELAALSLEFQTWLRAHDFPQWSADELLAAEALEPDEREYVEDFVARWDAAQATSKVDALTVRLTALGYEPEFDNGTGELIAIFRTSDGKPFEPGPTPGVWSEPPNDLRRGPAETLPHRIAGIAENLMFETMAGGSFDDSNGGPRYETYTLPGGKGYREILLTLPMKPSEAGLARRQAVFARWQPQIDAAEKEMLTWFGAKFYEKERELRNLEAARDAEADAVYKLPADKAYDDSHWDQQNIAVWVRLTERTDADGKRVLFIEEIQSGWAQKGRKHGFAKAVDPVAVNEAVTRNNEAAVVFEAADSLYERRKGDYQDAVAKLTRLRKEAVEHPVAERRQQAARDVFIAEGVVRETSGAMAEAGSARALANDALTLTAKELHDARYPKGLPRAPFVEKTDAWATLALKRAIKYAADNGYDRVAWTTGKQQADRYSLRNHIESLNYIRQRDGNYTLKGIPKGRAAEWRTFASDIPPNELSDYVGKEMAEKIIANASGSDTYHGVDLEVGGEGMLGFYDRILPKLAGNVLKKLGGGKVGRVQVFGGTVPAQAVEWGDAYERANNPERFKPEALTQPGFDITPEMRELAQQGMPMFKRKAPVAPLPSPPAPFTVEELQQRLAEVRAALDAKFGSELIDGLINRGILRLETAEESPSRLSLDPTVRAVMSERDYRGPGASIFYDRIDPRDAARLLMHEIGEHYGMPRMLGDKAYLQMLRKVAAAKENGDPEITAAWEYVKFAYQDEQGNPFFEEGDDNFVREVAAIVIEQAPYRGWVREVLDAIRAWLYRLVGDTIGNRLDANLLRGLATSALRKAGAGELAPALGRKTDDIRAEGSASKATLASTANLSADQLHALGRRIAAMGQDGVRLMRNLQNPELAGTPWAKQTIDGLLIRAAMDDYLAGVTPNFESLLDRPEAAAMRERLARGPDALWGFLDRVGMVGDAAKPVNNVNSTFANCDPSPACATYCYATRGNYPTFNPTMKAEVTNWAVETNPTRAADIIARNYKSTLEFERGKALRLFDKGDGSAAWLPVIERLNAAGIRTQIFSKRPEFLRQVSPFNVRLLSIDNTNLEVARANPDLPIAFIYSEASQIPFLEEMKGRIQVILPVKVGNRLLTQDEVKALPAWTKVYQCPLDNGIKRLPQVKNGDGWVCTKCDKNAGIGCFRGQSTAEVMKAAAQQPKPGAALDKAAKEFRDAIERSVPASQREDAARILDSLMAAIRAGVDIRPESESTQSSEGGLGSGRGGEGSRVSLGLNRRPGNAEVARFEGDGGRTLDDDAAAVVKARGDRLVGIDRKLRAQLKAGEITQDEWRAGRNAAAEQFLDAVASGFGDSAMAENVFNRLGLYRGTEGLFYALERANERIKNAIAGGPQVANFEAETRRLADAMLTPEQMADAMTGRSATPVPGEMAVDLMRAWSGALGFRVNAPQSRRSLLGNDASARGPRSRATPQPPVSQSNLDEEDTARLLQRKLFDRFNRVRQLQERIPGIRDDMNVVQADTLYYGRAQFLGEELERNFIVPLGDALRAAKKIGITLSDADDFLMARHAPERNRVVAQRNPNLPAGGSGMTDAQAAAIMGSFNVDQRAALDDIARIVDDMNADRLRRQESSGLITPQLAAALRQQYQFYVPLKNIEDEAEALGMGRGYELRNSGLEMAFGRQSKAGSPIANSMMDAAKAIVMSEKARVDQVLWNLAHDPRVADVLMPMSDALAQQHFARQRYNPTTRQIETIADPAWRNRDDVVKLRIAGEEQYLWVRDDVLRDQLRRVATLNDPGPILRAVGVVTGTIGRTLTEFNPAFTIPNGVRDAISVFIRARGIDRVSPLKVMAGIPLAWKMIVDFKRDANTPGAQLYREFQKVGGKTGAYGMTDAVDTFHHLERLGAELGYAGRTRGPVDRTWHALGTMAKWISHGNEVIEYATRLSLYKAAKEAGYTPRQAGVWAKEISVNFNRSGEYGRAMNSVFVFANAALQGLYGTMMFGKSHKVRMAMLGLVVLGAAAQAWNEIGGGDDDDTGEKNVNTLSDYQLDHNATVLAPGSSSGIKLPLPPEYAFLYATGRRLMRGFTQGDWAKETAGIVGALLGSTLPLRTPDASSIPLSGIKTLTPTAVAPFMDVAVNENFMGAPIVPTQRNPQAPVPYTTLARSRTSDAAKAMAEFLNTVTGGDNIEPGLAQKAFGQFVSPEAMEHIVGYYTGGIGQFALQSKNMAKTLAGDEEAVDPNKIPIANRFIFAQPQGYVSRRYRELAPDFQYAIAREREGSAEKVRPAIAAALDTYRETERELRPLFAELRQAGEQGDAERKRDLEQQIRQAQTRVLRAYNEARAE